MYKVPQIVPSIYYVGVNDRTKPLFENLWTIPSGVSYNAYLIQDEQTVLIDTVDVCYSDIFFHKLETILGDKPIDYLVINHMEPDHGGSIGLLRQRYPNIRIVGNKKTFEMLRGFHGITDNLHEVKAGDELCIGQHTLTFMMATMVHWPEVMFTYEKTQGMLFSADAFGTFGAINGHLMDTSADVDYYLAEMHRYYACIVGKYGAFVQKALSSIEKQGWTLNYICPAHGIVWTEAHLQKAYQLYNELSTYTPEEGAVIIYGSMYGNTEQLADIIAQSLAEAGVSKVVCHNVSKSDPSQIICDVFRYKAIIVGSPTYCNGLFSPIENILNLIRIREVKNRYYSVFGSAAWAPMAVKKLLPFAEEMKWELVGQPVELRMADLPSILDAAWQLGQDVATTLQSSKQSV